MAETETIALSKKEAQSVRTLIRVGTDLKADELLAGQQLTVTWEQARELGETLMEYTVTAMARAHERGAYGDLDYQHKRV